MRSRLSIHLSAVFILCASVLIAQENSELLDQYYFFPDLENYEHQELYGIALSIAESKEINDPNVSALAINSYTLDESRSIDLLLESSARSLDPQLETDVNFLIAAKYFERKDYIQSKKYWNKINPSSLDLDRRHQMQFKLAYCYLLDKNFQDADQHFRSVANSNHELAPHASYYEGICAFYLNDRERSIRNFEKVENNRNYKNLIPFYLAQIYFKDEDYDKAIKYGKSKIKNPGAATYLVDRILGLSYFALGDYDNAILHLESYANESDKITENDAFQLASAHYRTGNYSEAKGYFRELSPQKTQIGQMSNFLLASTSLKEGNTKDAQSAFKQASKLNYFPQIQEESEYLYYKTSAELGDERIAINGLSSMNSNHEYYEESQELLAVVLNNSQDTESALNVIENLDYKSKEMLSTYQNLSYQSGMQSLKDDNTESAIQHLQNAKEIKQGPVAQAEIDYRLAQAYDKASQIPESQQALNTYLDSGDKKYRFEANYLMAYQEMDQKKYDSAISKLETSLNDFDPDSDDKLLFDDVVVRLADLELVKNNYVAALEYYQLAISNNALDSDYILYQKSMIYGVNGQIIEKLTSLEDLLKSYPDSEYRDDALFQLAETLMELNKNNQAYQVYQTIILEHGSKSEYCSVSHMRQGLISYNQGDLYAALNSYKQGIEISTEKEERRRALMAIEDIYLYDLNEPDEYFKYTESLTGLKIDDISRDSIIYGIALNIYKDAKYEIAVDQFKAYLQNYPDGFYNEDAHYYLAESYLVLKQYSNALEEYLIILELDNSKFRSESLPKAAVIAFNHEQDYELSFSLYDKLISSKGDQADADQLESALYSAFITEKWSQVLKYGELYLMTENLQNDSKASAHYYMAKAYMALNKPDEAFTEFKALSEISDNNQAAEASYTMAKILYKQNKLDEAEEQAFKTADAASNYPYWVSRSILLLGDIYRMKKDYLNATAAYESIIENFKDREDILNEAQDKLKSLQEEISNESRIAETPEEEFISIDSSSVKNK